MRRGKPRAEIHAETRMLGSTTARKFSVLFAASVGVLLLYGELHCFFFGKRFHAVLALVSVQVGEDLAERAFSGLTEVKAQSVLYNL